MSDISTDVLEKFCSVTGSNQHIAKQYINVCNGNLDMAIGEYLENPQQIVSKDTNSSSTNDINREQLRLPIPSRTETLIPSSNRPILNGKRFKQNERKSVFDGFRNFQTESQMSNNNGGKRQTLEDLFRPPLDLLHKGSFSTARNEGKIKNKWLLVNIHNVEEFSCQVLNRDVWSCPSVRQRIANYFIFWQVYHDSEEGIKYAQFYKFEEWPYVAVLDPVTGEKLTSWHKLDSRSFCESVDELLAIRGYRPSGDNIKQSNVVSIIDKSEEEQMREAIEASLRKSPSLSFSSGDDDCIEVVSTPNKISEGKQKRRLSIEEISDHNENSVCKKSKLETRESFMDYFGMENDEKSHIVLRFPSGERKSLVLPCTSKLKALYLYIKEAGLEQESYELITNFPKRILCNFDSTLKDLGLHPHYTIFVVQKDS